MADSLNLLVVGRNGNGKTSVSRTIRQLGQDKLVPHDTDNIGDKMEDLTCSIEEVFQKATDYVKTCDSMGGVHAILFVVKCGTRFTKQDMDAVAMVKSIFGENIFEDHVIIVFSRGDQFYLENEEQCRNFDTWCKEQTGDMKDLFSEVNNRYILLDNKQLGRKENKEQMEKLGNIVSCMNKIPEKNNKVGVMNKRLQNNYESHWQRIWNWITFKCPKH